MASGDSSYKLVVGNLPDSMIDDFLVTLFFESPSDCPDGGSVEDVEMLPDRGKAVVTFEDSEVVSRLLSRKTVIYKDAELTIQRFKDQKDDDNSNSSDADDEENDDDNKGDSCYSHDCNEENESNCETKSKDDSSVSNAGDNADSSDEEVKNEEDTRKTDADKHLKPPSVENLIQMKSDPDESDHDPSDVVKDVDEYYSLEEDEDDVTSDPQHAEADAEPTKTHTDGSTELPKSHVILSHSNNNSGSCSETGEENLCEEQKNENIPNQLQTSVEDKGETLLLGKKCEDAATVTSKEIHTDNAMLSAEINEDEIKLPNQKVKLLKILSEAKVLSESVAQCVTNFDVVNGKVILTGTSDNIDYAKLKLYESASVMSTFRVEMRRETSELLFTAHGSQWLEKEFQQHAINAALYQKDNSIHVIASDDNTYEEATRVLQEILAVKVIPFQDDHLEYLRSATWKKSMNEFSAKEIIHINVDFSCIEITVEGQASSVKLISEKISAALKANSKVTESITLSKGDLRLVKEHSKTLERTVKDAIFKSLGDQKVEIEYKDACIELRGSRDAIEEANRVISAEYLPSIQHLPFEVNMRGLTIEAFTTKDAFGEEIIEHLERKHECVIEVSERSQDPSTDTLPDVKAVDASESVGIIGGVKAVLSYVVASVLDSKPDPLVSTSIDVPKIASNITIQMGSLVDFQADVLISPIAQPTRQLVKAGAVAKSFYQKGKDVLQQEFDQVGSPRDFGKGISVTSNAAGVFLCKKIYHVAIRSFRDQHSVELLKQMICGCLKKAEGENMTSIAFPTVGCGKLGYRTKDVVRCFNEAALDSTLQVYIIGYEQATCDAFTSYLTQPTLSKPQEPVQQKLEAAQPNPLQVPATQQNAATPPPVTKKASSLIRNVIAFNIVAFDKKTADQARAALAKKLGESLTDTKVEKEMIAHLSEDMISTIRGITSASKIDLHIDRQNQTIQLSGHHALVRVVRTEIDQLLAKEEKNLNDLQYIKRTKGVQAYLSKLSTTEDLQLPKHWTHYRKHDQPYTGSVTTLLQPGTEVYKAVEAMVMGTWDATKAGQGSDAANLKHSSIAIKTISAVENPNMFYSYKLQLKILSHVAQRKLFKPVTSLQAEAEIATKSVPGVNYLYDDLVSEVNEYYLLHGTSHQQTIVRSGIDFRFCGDKVLFGKGAYFAEKSTKADQYADSKSQRKPNGEKLYMFVARVLLGEPHLCQKPYPYKKAPCSDATCQSESCSSDHLPCDSVIGTHKNCTVVGTTVRLLFREFIIYHMERCYPEFLVEYVRQ